MPEQSWTIGSDPACDIVVDNATVSAFHCRLQTDGKEFEIEDLGSTNGTYVNGERISDRQTVSSADRVTLGTSLRMPWPDIGSPTGLPSEPARSSDENANQQVITLGRGAGNTVVLEESNVSAHHARITLSGNEVVLEDLGSTNGTSVGKVENKIHRAVIDVGDTVFLGSTPYQVADLIARAKSNSRITDSLHGSVQRSRGWLASHRTAVSIGSLVSLCLILLAWMLVRDRDAETTRQASASNPDVGEPVFVRDQDLNDPGHGMESRRQETGSPQPDSQLAVAIDAAARTAEAPTAEEKLARSLYVIVCSDADRKTPFRVGTGFAIDSQHVATSAAVIESTRSLMENGFPEVFLFSPTMVNELNVQSTSTHSQYEFAKADALQAQQEHDALFDKLESQPPKPDEFEAAKEELLAARTKALLAIERKTTYDVGVIQVSQALLHWLPGVESDAPLRPKLKLDVTGYAFDVEDPYFDPSISIDLSTMSSRVQKILKMSNEAPARLQASGTLEQTEYAYLGSPVINGKGQVVAIYSRPTPPKRETDEPQVPETFDAALYQRIRDCLTVRR